MRALLNPLFVLVLVLVLVLDASAQENVAPRPPSAPAAVPPTATAAPKKKGEAERKEKFKTETDDGFNVDAIESRFDPDKGVSYAIGNVHLDSKKSGRIQLFADGVVIWGKVTGTKNLAADVEVYAEGNVFLQAFGDTFEADWLWIDFRTGEGRFEKGTARLGTRTTGIEGFDRVLARADRARVEDDLRIFLGEDVEVSTCTFHEPHFGVRARSVRLERVEVDEVSAEEGGASSHALLSIERPRFEMYGQTVFGYPWTLGWDTAWNPYIPRARFGKSGRFGAFLLSEIPIFPGRELEVRAKVDLYERRGVGVGGVAEWGGPADDRQTYLGFLEGMYIDDRADTDRSTGLPPPDDERGRVRAFHRDDLPFGFRREFELSYLSDRAFLPEFYEKEFKTGKEQETVAYMRWWDPLESTCRHASLSIL